jgi:hypothetical protein
VAEAYYKTISAGCKFSGAVTTVGAELPAVMGYGQMLNLTGGVTAWATMAAPIHAVSWELETCEVTRRFGPNPALAVGDFLDFLRLLNKRPYACYTTNERTGDELGDSSATSARGDTVGAFDVPETTYGAGGGGAVPGQFDVTLAQDESDDWVATISPGYVRYLNAASGSGAAVTEEQPDGIDEEHAVAAGDALYCRVQTDVKGTPTSIEIEVSEAGATSTHYQPPTAHDAGVEGDYFYLIAEILEVDDKLEVRQVQHGGPIHHVAQLWEGTNIGDGIDMLKERKTATDSYEFRRIKQLELEEPEEGEEGVALIKPEEDQPDQVEWRAIVGKVISGADDPLIKVKASSDGKVIEVSPDGWRGNVTVPAGTLEIVGGMVNKFEEATDLPANFDMMVREVDIEVYDVPGGFEAYTTPRIDDQLLFRVRNGIILRGGTHLPGTPTIVIETTHVSGPAPPAG